LKAPAPPDLTAATGADYRRITPGSFECGFAGLAHARAFRKTFHVLNFLCRHGAANTADTFHAGAD
jgi:hypothetical protein